MKLLTALLPISYGAEAADPEALEEKPLMLMDLPGPSVCSCSTLLWLSPACALQRGILMSAIDTTTSKSPFEGSSVHCRSYDGQAMMTEATMTLLSA